MSNEGYKDASEALFALQKPDHIVLEILDQLHRTQKITMDHVLTVRHYVRLQTTPDWRHEKKAYRLWQEVLQHVTSQLITRGLLKND